MTRYEHWRCPRCNRLLAKVRLSADSVIEIVCERCGAVVIKQMDSSLEQPPVDHRARLVSIGS